MRGWRQPLVDKRRVRIIVVGEVFSPFSYKNLRYYKMKNMKLNKAVAMVIAGAALSVGGISVASATATTAYNTFHGNSNGVGVPCSPCAPGTTDGWTHTGGIGNGGAAQAWVGTPGGARPFGYIGSPTLNWAADFSEHGSAIISNADSIARYGLSADIDTAKGAWSDTAVAGAGGWKHDLDIGLFKSDVGLTVSLDIKGVNFTNTNFGFTIVKGMSTSTGAYSHHGSWNGNQNGTNLPTQFGFTAAQIVATSFGVTASNPTPDFLNNISFYAQAGQVYTIFLGGYRDGAWFDTTDGYVLNISAVPEPASLSLFGIAAAAMGAVRRRKANLVA